LIDYFSEIPNTLPLQIDVCKQTIQWTIQEKRIFLKQALETRLIALYLDNKMYSDALALVATLLKELKKLDDKMVLVEVQLLESRVCHALHNLPKARVSIHTDPTRIISPLPPSLRQNTMGATLGFATIDRSNRVSILLGCTHLGAHICKRHLLSTSVASSFGYASRNSSR
jgi:26S proteasome regulatory subunit N6